MTINDELKNKLNVHSFCVYLKYFAYVYLNLTKVSKTSNLSKENFFEKKGTELEDTQIASLDFMLLF